ncbi:Nramp family divalent metal transporter [Streptomyces longwoodensis]|uniref:Nramp family divalent metal transporter n=1 Tax=Streptomyces longwoodensis TaxID=68231 RepID=UPI0033FFD39D
MLDPRAYHAVPVGTLRPPTSDTPAHPLPAPVTPTPPREPVPGKSRPRRPRAGFRAALAMLGPCLVVSVAYMDPGNFATNMTAGTRYGPLLLWVIGFADIMAVFVQYLACKLGVATGRDLPELCRERVPGPVARGLWVQAELVAMATDLAEFVGGAVALHLLFGMPLLPAAFVVAGCSLLLLMLAPEGRRRFETVTAVLLLPADRPLARKRQALRAHRTAIVVALGLAGLVNAAMLVLAASTLHGSGRTAETLDGFHRGLGDVLGPGAAVAFALALLASGLASAGVGTFAGQVIMRGFLHRQVPLTLRRILTMTPPLAVLALGTDPTRALVLSQVVLSFGIPFALVPLLLFTARRSVMGPLVNRPSTTVAAVLVCAVVVGLNLFLVGQALL